MKSLIFSAFFLWIGMKCVAQESQVIIGMTHGGWGKYSGYVYQNVTGDAPAIFETKWSPGVGFNIGYQLECRLTQRFFLTTAILGKALHGKVESFDWDGTHITPWADKGWMGGLSLNGIINYRIYSGLYVGVGIEPSFYLKTNNLKENKNNQVVDFPVTLTLGYKLSKGMRLSLNYNQGFKPLYENQYSTNVNNHKELGITLGVPLF